MGFIRLQLDKTLYMNYKQSIYIILYVDNIKIIRLNNHYLNKINRQLADKYIMSNITYSNQYLDMEFICDGCNGILQIQQQKIEKSLKEFKLKNSNAVKVLMEDYLQPLPDRY